MNDSAALYKQFGLEPPSPFSTKLSLHIGEENNEMRLIIKHHLQKIGFSNIRTGKDGHEILDELTKTPADIIIEGDDLVNLNGYELLKELTEDPATKRPAFVLISKPLSKSELMLILENGVDDVMVRPLAQADLYPKIKSAYENFISVRNPERLYEFAKAKLRSKELDIVERVYKAILENNDKAARPLVGLARASFLQNKIDEALKYLEQAVTRNENYIHAYALRGEIYMSQKLPEKAMVDFKKAIKISPLNVVRYEKPAEFLIKANRVTECLQLLTIGLQAGLKHPYVIERAGYCYFVEKDYPRALRYLKEAVRIEPENVSFLNSLAICYRDCKDFDKAVQTYNTILKKQPDNHLVLFNKAITLVLEEKKDEAIKILHRVLKIDPNYTKAQQKLKELEASTSSALHKAS